MEMMAHQDKEVEEFRVSNDVLGDREALRGRLAEEGYVFLRGVMDRDKLMA